MKKYETQSTEYNTWNKMISRCYDKNDERYKDWGGRGITVCDRWRYSFNNFLKDMGRKPKGKISIDRINNNGNYSPENCKWSDHYEQANNRRNNVKVTIDNITKTISEWCLVYDLKTSSVFDRINKRGWSPKEALIVPITKSPLIKYNGEIKSLYQWSKELKLHPQSVSRCVRKGMTPEEALLHVKEHSWKTMKKRL